MTDDAAFCGNCGSPNESTNGGAVATTTDPGAASAAPAAAEDQLLAMVKQELGKDYRIEKELGRGGMAVVYKGVETALERIVAIKVVPPESANAGQAAERFRREARLAASLDHPNIIPVYRVGQAGPLHYMAMKFVEGRAVDAIVENQGPLPVNVALAILKYSALGLAFAHDKKIVHRDIKGANILVDKDGRVMVSDFGIARALEEVSLTASGMMIGTPYFMSPEQCGGQKVSPQSDQYSLGIMGFQLLTGEVPFLADSMVGVIQHHYMTPVPDITAVRQDVPKELLDIIYCSLNKDPGDRFATTKDMATALENVPQTEVQREEAEKILKMLSMGEAIPKVRTGTLPPLSLTISGPGPRIQPRPTTTPRTRPAQAAPVRKKKKKNRKPMYIGLGFMGVAMAGAGAMIVSQQSQARVAAEAERIRQDSIQQVAAAAAAVARSQGKLVFTGPGVPASSPILVCGRVFTVNTLDSLPPATCQATLNVPGYQPWQQVVPVTPNTTDTIPINLVLASAAPSAPTQTGRVTAAARVDSGEVRFTAARPIHAEVFVDGRSIGSGMMRKNLPVGPHVVEFRAAGCDPIQMSITVSVTQQVTVPPQTLACR